MPWSGHIRQQTSFAIAALLLLLLGNTDAVRGDAVTRDGKYFKFASRPDIQAPVWDITSSNDTLVADGYWFIAPYEIVTQVEPANGWVGPYIYNSDGQLIWSGASMFGRWNVFDFGLASVQGEPHLTLLDWHKQRGVVLDSGYRTKRTTPLSVPGDTFQNMHAYHVIEDGTHALTLTNRRRSVPNDVTSMSGNCEADFQGLREWDLQPAYPKKLFEWDGNGHIALNESKFTDNIDRDCRGVWDLMHANAIDKFPDGDYLLSARHTDTLYKISHVDGAIVWRLGGLKSDFQFLKGIRFSRQHHGTVLEQNATHCVISLFDNAKAPDSQVSTQDSSRGLILSLDMEHMTVDLVAQYHHPRGDLIDGRGSFQVLPNGNVFAGWAESSRISEHSAGGQLLLEAALRARHDTYRAFKFPWIGRPSQPPDVYSEISWPNDNTTTTVHMSWNGATEVATWNVHGNDANGNSINLGSTPCAGFETTMFYDGYATNVYADAIDRHGKLLGTSKRALVLSTPRGNESLSNNVIIWAIMAMCIFGLAIVIAFAYARRRRRLHSTGTLDLAKGDYQLLKTDNAQDDQD